MSDQTSKKIEVYNFVIQALKSVSTYAVWDEEQMHFQPNPHVLLATEADVDWLYYDGAYKPSDMFVMKAIAALTCSGVEHIAALTEFYRREDIRKASAEGRTKLAIPQLDSYGKTWSKLIDFCHTGIVERYDFRPQIPAEGREDKEESVFLASAHGVRLYRKVLNKVDFPFDPFDNIVPAHEAFSYCLQAEALCPFLYSRCLKSVKFKYMQKILNKRHKANCLMTFNPDGAEAPSKDEVDVFVEGITFRTCQNYVPEATRYDYVTRHVSECLGIVKAHLEGGRDSYIVFCCEDGPGMQKLTKIVYEQAPDLLDRCLFTSGNVLRSADALHNPRNLRNCFLKFDMLPDGKYQLDGVTEPFWIKIDEDGFAAKKL